MTTVPTSGQAPAGGGVLLERDHELGVLEGCVQGAWSGEAVLVLIEGPAGIGKSRLLAKAREMAGAAGVRVLSARGSDLERELPYGIVRQLFEPLLREPDGVGRTLRPDRRRSNHPAHLSMLPTAARLCGARVRKGSR